MTLIIRRLALAALLFFAAAPPAFAQSMKGEIASVDAVANSLVVATKKGAAPQTYILKFGAEVTLNGNRAKLADLTGMMVQVTSAEKGFANRLAAVGVAAAEGGGVELRTKLIGTKWIWYETDTHYELIKFEKDGFASWSRKHDGDFKWEVTPDGKRVEGLHVQSGHKFKMTFDATLSKGRIFEGGEPGRDSIQIKPRPAGPLTPVEQKLIGTTWQWFENANIQETITFSEPGKAKWSKPDTGDFVWEPTADGKGITGANLQTRFKFKATFDATFTKGKITSFGATRDTHKIR